MQTYGLKLFFGVGNNPRVPVGWTVTEKPNDWVIATDPSGQEHYIGDGIAFPRKVATKAAGRLEIGQTYADTDNTIQF